MNEAKVNLGSYSFMQCPAFQKVMLLACNYWSSRWTSDLKINEEKKVWLPTVTVDPRKQLTLEADHCWPPLEVCVLQSENVLLKWNITLTHAMIHIELCDLKQMGKFANHYGQQCIFFNDTLCFFFFIAFFSHSFWPSCIVVLLLTADVLPICYCLNIYLLNCSHNIA